MTTKKLLGACTCLVIVFALGCSKVRNPQDTTASGLSQDPSLSPRIACDEQEHNFGTVSQGEEAKHTFVIKNKGKGVLKIERAKGG